MYLSAKTKVSEEVRRIINNGFESHHPFKSPQDYLSILDEVRQLPLEEFKLCLETIKQVVEKHSGCYGCHGKGLA